MKLLEFLFSPASFKFAGQNIEGPAILVIPSVLALIIAFVASLIWLYRDAVKRRKNGVLALIFILLTGWPVSFIWWLWLRPALAPSRQ